MVVEIYINGHLQSVRCTSIVDANNQVQQWKTENKVKASDRIDLLVKIVLQIQ